jgi:MFS family permease
MTFIIMGSLGLLLVPAVLLLLGPRQELSSDVSHRQVDLKAAFTVLRQPCLLLIFVASAFVGIAGYALSAFGPAFLMRSHGMTLAEMGLKQGLASGLTSIIGILVMGWLTDRLTRRDPRWGLWLVCMMTFGLLPCSVGAFLAQSPWLSVTLLAISTLISTAYLPPIVASIQRLVPSEMRATVSASLLLFTAIAGGSGPFVVGLISDALVDRFHEQALSLAMLIVPLAQAVAGFLYFAASAGFRQSLVDE